MTSIIIMSIICVLLIAYCFLLVYLKIAVNNLKNKQEHNKFEVGDVVIFNDKVYNPPYSPYYDAYYGYLFRVVKLHYDEGLLHIELGCIAKDDVKVNGYVHPEDLILVQKF